MRRSSVQNSNVQDRVTDFANRAWQTGSDYFGLKVKIAGGYHRSVMRTLNQLDFTIGSDPSDDICVFADPVAAGHIEISRAHFLSGTVRISAAAGAITLEDGEQLKTHAWAERPLPTSLVANGLEVDIERAMNVPGLLRPAAVIALIVGMIWLALSLFSTLGDIFKSVPVQMASVMAPMEQGAQAEYAEQLRRRIDQSGLTQRIRVQQEGKNALIATGSINPSETTAWRAILQWYDSTGARVPLIDNVAKTTAENAAPSIASVWFTQGEAQVQLSDRTIIAEGDTFSDNWKIDDVDRQGVTLSRDGRQIKLTFNETGQTGNDNGS